MKIRYLLFIGCISTVIQGSIKLGTLVPLVQQCVITQCIAVQRAAPKIPVIERAQATLINERGTILHPLFSPDDNPKQILLGLLDAEQEKISIAAYLITDNDIAQHIIQAHLRGVPIEIVTDRTTLQSQWNKFDLLQAHHIPIFIFQPEVRDAIMHNKFIILRKSINNKSILWTGSFNFSRAAAYKNQENVLVLDDMSIIQAYTNQFEKLKQRSLPLHENIQPFTFGSNLRTLYKYLLMIKN